MSSIDPEVRFARPEDAPRSVRSAALRFGATLGIAFGVLALLVHRRGHDSIAAPLAAAVVALLVLSVASPRAALAVRRAWMRGARFVGAVNTALLLGTAYFVLVTPLALVFRAVKGTPFRRKRGTSYLVPRTEPRDRRHFERPF